MIRAKFKTVWGDLTADNTCGTNSIKNAPGLCHIQYSMSFGQSWDLDGDPCYTIYFTYWLPVHPAQTYIILQKRESI